MTHHNSYGILGQAQKDHVLGTQLSTSDHTDWPVLNILCKRKKKSNWYSLSNGRLMCLCDALSQASHHVIVMTQQALAYAEN